MQEEQPFAAENVASPPTYFLERRRATMLAFRTPPGGVVIPAGQSKELGTVDASPFERIRVVADERVGSGQG